MTIIINPGSGPVAGTRENADRNIAKFIKDVTSAHNFKYISSTFVCANDDGRFTYLLDCDDVEAHEIEMPGLPLEQVRWVDQSQNIWDFPRLYVDGSSWVWKYAVNVCKDEPDDE